jgi:hypothetical protein
MLCLLALIVYAFNNTLIAASIEHCFSTLLAIFLHHGRLNLRAFLR